MKKLLLTLLCAGAVSSAFAQGTLNFASAAAGVNAPGTNQTSQVAGAGTRATGTAFLAQLYVGAAGITDASLLATNSGAGPAFFNTGSQAGYFTGGQRIINGFAGGSTITAQVRAWNAAFPSWEEAPVSERTALTGPGAPNLIQVTLATPPATPVALVGLAGYNIGGVPEPSTIALGLLGLGAVALFRRRK